MTMWLAAAYLLVSAGCVYSVSKLYSDRKKAYAKSALTSYILYTMLFAAAWVFAVKVPWYSLLLTMLALLANCFLGYHRRLYVRSKTFDRALHAYGAFSFSLLTYFALGNYFDMGPSPAFRALGIFFIGNTLGLNFELAEAFHDSHNKVKDQRGLTDTNMDMFFDVLGSAAAAVSAFLFIF